MRFLTQGLFLSCCLFCLPVLAEPVDNVDCESLLQQLEKDMSLSS